MYALEAEGELQGLRMLQVSDDEVEQYGIHALRVSTAPWNRPPEPRYRGVGTALVAVAVRRSIRDGRQGQVHCESLPGAEPFHLRNGMVAFDGLSTEGLARLRFTAEAGYEFLRRVIQEGLIDG